MSLVNDALKKARLEAARTEAENRGVPYPLLGRGHRPKSDWPRAGALVAVLVLGIGAGGFLLFRAGRQSALRPEQIAQVAEQSSIPKTNAAAPDASAPPSPSTSNPEPQTKRRQQAAESQGPRGGTSSKVGALDNSLTGRERADSIASPVRQAPSSQQEPATNPVPSSAVTPATKRLAERNTAAAPASGPASTPSQTDRVAPPSDDTQPSAATEPASVPPVAQDSPAEAAPREFLRSAEVAGIGPIELGGIAWSGDRPFALVNGRVVRPGDSILGLFVEDIQPNTVRLRSNDGALIFRLK